MMDYDKFDLAAAFKKAVESPIPDEERLEIMAKALKGKVYPTKEILEKIYKYLFLPSKEEKEDEKD